MLRESSIVQGLLAGGFFCMVYTTAANAATITGTGDWSDVTKWTGGVPNGTGIVAEHTSGGPFITAVDAAVGSTLTLGRLSQGTQQAWTINSGTGPADITFDATGTGTAVFGRTANNGGAGSITLNPNMVIATGDTLSIRNVSGSGTGALTSVAVTANGSITGTGTLNVRQGDTPNNGANGGRAIDINGQINNSGQITITSGNVGSSARITTTGNIRFDGGIGSNVNGVVIDAENRSTVIFTNTFTFNLAANTGIAFNSSTTAGIGGALNIAGLTLDFGSSLATLPSYILLDYSNSEIARLTLATNALTDDTFGGALNIPVNYEIFHDTVNDQVRLQLIPEPASLAMLALGSLIMIPRRRR